MILSQFRVKYSIRINITSTREAGLDGKVVGIATGTRLFDFGGRGRGERRFRKNGVLIARVWCL